METERSVIDYIEEKRLVWYGHVQRAQNRWINKVTEWSPLGRRKRGRPRSCLLYTSLSKFHVNRFTITEAIAITDYHTRTRAQIHTKNT